MLCSFIWGFVKMTCSHNSINSEGELDEEGDAEVHDDASLLDFAATLQKAHEISERSSKEEM